MTQSALAASLGITFQQVQKYESAATRISASMLAKAAAALDVRIDELFPDRAEAADENTLVNQLITSARGGEELLLAYADIPSTKLRRAILAMTRAMAKHPPQVENARA
jgi:transcriptional regulator with XRE-family HTH domain